MPTASWLALHSEIPKIARPIKNKTIEAKIPKTYCWYLTSLSITAYYKPMTKKILVYLSAPVAFTFIFSFFAPPALAGILLTNEGQLVYQEDQVLGEQDDRGGAAIRELPAPVRRLLPQPGKSTSGEPSRIRLENAGDLLKVQVKSQNGRETEINSEKIMEIAPRGSQEEKNRIRITTEDGQGKMVISRNEIRARTHFPLSVDPETNELIVTTPAGEKRVTVLPDQAVKNLTERGLIDRVEPSTNEINLAEAGGEPVYEIEGESDKKFFGFMPVKIRSKIKISAETGEVVRTEKTIRDRLFDLFSF